MVCWSSEPEANKLKETEDKYASGILFYAVPNFLEWFDHSH